jgi:Cytochrome c7 and related cytochrome c
VLDFRSPPFAALARVALTLAGLGLGLGLARSASADDFLKSSPGELAVSHASIDKQDQCTTCHEPDNSVSAAKCLGCHDHQDLKKRIDAGVGFHASSKVKGRDCKLCHQEHRGRGFDLMGWKGVGGVKAFDHQLTGWELKGKHAAADCSKCHTTSNKQGLRTYLNTEKTCGSCHSKDQPHGQIRQRFMACDRCHTESVWKPQKAKLDFDHNSKDQAAMPLEGSHADVACSKCHAKAAFKLPKFDGDCVQCHNSPHDGQLFSTKKCQVCHSPALNSLREVRFDHKKEAHYPLVGKHAQAECESCHTKALGKRKPEGACESCHTKDSKHGDRFAKFPACTTCHSQHGWKAGFQFNHGANTEFELTSKHTKASCRDCHRGKSPSDFERFDVTKGCMSCHEHAKAHGGKFKNQECLSCHQEGGSKKMSKDSLEIFHGEKSKFPLRNGHGGVQCQMCHVNDIYQETSPECGTSCHEDTLHRGSLGQECSRCHEPGQWPAVRFDHKADTKWPLEGKHQAIKDCESCHPARKYTKTPTTCSAGACHKNDDIHQGKLGDKCETCHSVQGSLLFRHNRDAKFAIDGKHTPLLCAACHTSVAFKPVPKDCVGCHPEPAIHKGRYGLECQRCHSTQSFTDTKARHDVGDFSLTGAHDQLACARCHPNGDKLRGSGNLCITCHRKDDIHNNSLSPRCGECHTQRSFSPARFDHMSTGCALMGLHSSLPCADCHKGGNYGAVSPVCVSCHRNEAQRVQQPDHRTLIDCGTCHNPSAWVPATQLGRQTICR